MSRQEPDTAAAPPPKAGSGFTKSETAALRAAARKQSILDAPALRGGDIERMTKPIHVQMTTTEKEELRKAAKAGGFRTLSDYVRQLLFARSPAVMALSISNPDAGPLMRELRTIGVQLPNVGSNLNQLAHHANATGAIKHLALLEDAIVSQQEIAALVKQAIAKVLTL